MIAMAMASAGLNQTLAFQALVDGITDNERLASDHRVATLTYLRNSFCVEVRDL